MAGCLCCGKARSSITDVVLACCGLVAHGVCLSALRECPECGDVLEKADALYKRASELITRNKYHLQRGTMVCSDIMEVYALHLDAAKQGHVQAQLRVYEAHSMGIIVEKNDEIAIYFLSLAAGHSPVDFVSAHAKVQLGDYYFAAGDYKRAQSAYYGAMQFFSVFKNKAVHRVCAKVFNRMGEIMRHKGDTPKASAYFAQAVVLDAGNADYHHDLGVQHAIEGDFAKAEHEHRACLQLNPKHALAHYAVGFLLAKRGDKKKAAVFFTRSLQLGHFGAKKQLDRLK